MFSSGRTPLPKNDVIICTALTVLALVSVINTAWQRAGWFSLCYIYNIIFYKIIYIYIYIYIYNIYIYNIIFYKTVGQYYFGSSLYIIIILFKHNFAIYYI